MFHHVRGLTPGVTAFADELREAGHTVHLPDLFDGHLFDTVEDGFAHLQEQGGGNAFVRRAVDAAEQAPSAVVYLGHSLGVMAAQQLAQNRPGALGGVFLYSFVPPSEFGSWPDGMPAQIHGASGDEFFAADGDLAAAREFTASTPGTELFVYDGDAHLFADASTSDHDPQAAALVLQRVLEFLSR